MKVRDSGMPDEATWQSFFDPQTVLEKLGLDSSCGDAIELGCGYGTFTIPAARIVRGAVHALDIEPDMIETTRIRARDAGVDNIVFDLRDFMGSGTGLADGSVDYAMMFNILHPQEPVTLLREAHRILRTGGRMGILHWRYDPATPRGPDMSFRPRPEQCRGWAVEAGFVPDGDALVELPPYHWGMTLRKP